MSYELGEIYGGMMNPFAINNAPNLKVGKYTYEQFIDKRGKLPSPEDYALLSRGGALKRKQTKRPVAQLNRQQLMKRLMSQFNEEGKEKKPLSNYYNISNDPKIGKPVRQHRQRRGVYGAGEDVVFEGVNQKEGGSVMDFLKKHKSKILGAVGTVGAFGLHHALNRKQKTHGLFEGMGKRKSKKEDSESDESESDEMHTLPYKKGGADGKPRKTRKDKGVPRAKKNQAPASDPASPPAPKQKKARKSEPSGEWGCSQFNLMTAPELRKYIKSNFPDVAVTGMIVPQMLCTIKNKLGADYWKEASKEVKERYRFRKDKPKKSKAQAEAPKPAPKPEAPKPANDNFDEVNDPQCPVYGRDPKKENCADYKKLIMKYHPDKNPKCPKIATERFKELGKMCGKGERPDTKDKKAFMEWVRSQKHK